MDARQGKVSLASHRRDATPCERRREIGARTRHYLCLNDFEAAARRRLPKPIFGYVQGANQDFLSLADNRVALDALRLVPRILRDVRGRSQEVDLFGTRYAAPFGIAPMGICALTGYRGDLSLARAARAGGIPMVVSSSALISLEEIAEAAPGGWFQLYVPRQPEAVDALVDRVASAGYAVLVVTVDTPLVPVREDNLRNGFRTPLRPGPRLAWDGLTHPRWLFGTFLRTIARHGVPTFANSQPGAGPSLISRTVARDFSGREFLDWDVIRRIRTRWRGALVLKGVLHPEDAVMAARIGADGIIVSNHGGRQLDGAPSPIRMLPRIVEQAGPLTVMIDSGFRRGNDILKAMALGARFAFVGRPFNYASAVAGEAGVAHAIALLKGEIHANMALLGVRHLSELGPDFILQP